MISTGEITILGGGIGGLTTALALAQRGAKVVVLEQAPVLAEIGAGLQITPNGMAVLAKLGLGGEMARIGLRLDQVSLRDYATGQQVIGLDMAPPPRGNPQPYLLVHRADLIGVLAQAVQAAGVEVRLDHPVAQVDFDDQRASLTLADGRVLRPGILLAADGVHSATRRALTGGGAPHFTGQVAWRATVDATALPARQGPTAATVYMGPGRHLVTYPLRNGRLVNVVAVEERRDWVAEGWHHRDDPAQMRAAFAGWCPAVQAVLNACETCHIWGLFRHPVAAEWSRGGAVALLGDACHPTLPFLAQGANMAIEDAWVLAAELERQADAAAAFAAYRARRQARVARIVASSTGNSRIYHLRSGAFRALAHLGMRMASQYAPTRLRGRFDWLYDHDVTQPD